MDRVQEDGGPPVERVLPFSSRAQAPEPAADSKHGVDPHRTKLADANAGGAAADAGPSEEEVEEEGKHYPSYVRRRSAGVRGNDGDGDGDGEWDTEKGYVGGDRVRLLVGRYEAELTLAGDMWAAVHRLYPHTLLLHLLEYHLATRFYSSRLQQFYSVQHFCTQQSRPRPLP